MLYLLLVFAAYCVASISACGEGWYVDRNQSICLLAVKDRTANFLGARFHCQSIGGDLAMNVYTYKNRKVATGIMRSHDHFWVGLKRNFGGIFTYVNDDHFPQQPPFEEGLPADGSTMTSDDCLAMKCGRWSKVHCQAALNFLCQKNFCDTCK